MSRLQVAIIYRSHLFPRSRTHLKVPLISPSRTSPRVAHVSESHLSPSRTWSRVSLARLLSFTGRTIFLFDKIHLLIFKIQTNNKHWQRQDHYKMQIRLQPSHPIKWFSIYVPKIIGGPVFSQYQIFHHSRGQRGSEELVSLDTKSFFWTSLCPRSSSDFLEYWFSIFTQICSNVLDFGKYFRLTELQQRHKTINF